MSNRLLSAIASSLILVFAGVAVPAGGASAHAELESSDPKDGASLTARPASVTLTFAEQIDAGTARSRVTVAADDDADYSYDPEPTVDGEKVIVPLEEVTEGGVYTVTYRVVSEDAHPVEGSVTFTVTAQPASEESPSDETTTEPAPSVTATAPATTVPVPGTGQLPDDLNPAWLYLVAALAVLAAGGTAVAMVTRRRTP